MNTSVKFRLVKGKDDYGNELWFGSFYGAPSGWQFLDRGYSSLKEARSALRKRVLSELKRAKKKTKRILEWEETV